MQSYSNLNLAHNKHKSLHLRFHTVRDQYVLFNLLVLQILTQRKLFILPSKVSVYPSNAISLNDVAPRFDEVRGTLHLEASLLGACDQRCARHHHSASMLSWAASLLCAECFKVLRDTLYSVC